MKKGNRNREELLEDAFINNGFEYKNKTYKSLTAEAILLLKRANSPIFTGQIEDLYIETILDYLIVCGQPRKTVLEYISKDTWDDARFELASQFTAGDLKVLGELVTLQLATISASLVEVRDGEEKK